MALITIPNLGIPVWPHMPLVTSGHTNNTLDAAGESLAFVGRLLWETGPGSSKVVSSAGGKIYWLAGSAITFANAGTTLRIGINDLGVTGLEDGTHDVHGELVGGTDTITADAIHATVMETGTKTLAHLAEIAVVLEMTTRGGVDSVQVATYSQSRSYPYATADTGAGPAKDASLNQPVCAILADDGTLGWIESAHCGRLAGIALNTGTTPDEIAIIWTATIKNAIVGIEALISLIASADTFEYVLYSDPLGTPVAERTATANPVLNADGGGLSNNSGRFATAFTPTVGADYAFAFRPTSANNISLFEMLFGSGNAILRKTTPFGTGWRKGSRSDQTGAFTVDTEVLPIIGPIFSAFDDGVSAGGGGRRPRLVTMS